MEYEFKFAFELVGLKFYGPMGFLYWVSIACSDLNPSI